MTLRVNQRMAVLPGRALGDRRLDDRHLRVLAVLCLVEDPDGSQGRDGCPGPSVPACRRPP